MEEDCKIDTNNFDTLVTTAMAIKSHRVKWILKDFSKLPVGTEFSSSPIKPVPSYEWNLIFKKEKNSCLYLISKSNIELNFELSIFDLNGKRWYHDSQVNVTFSKDSKRDILRCTENILKELNSVRDDTLIFICDFKICLNIITETHEMHQKEDTKLAYGQEKLLSDLKTMYQNQQCTDLVLIADEEMLHVHKSIMCARSPVFEKMFQHQMNEKENNFVEIDDIRLSELKKLVDFLYSGVYNTEEEVEMIYALYYAADKYEVLDLRKMCADTLLTTLTVDNATRILIWADRHKDEYLKAKVNDFLVGHFSTIADTAMWDKFVSSETKLAAETIIYYTKKLTLKK